MKNYNLKEIIECLNKAYTLIEFYINIVTCQDLNMFDSETINYICESIFNEFRGDILSEYGELIHELNKSVDKSYFKYKTIDDFLEDYQEEVYKKILNDRLKRLTKNTHQNIRRLEIVDNKVVNGCVFRAVHDLKTIKKVLKIIDIDIAFNEGMYQMKEEACRLLDIVIDNLECFINDCLGTEQLTA